MRARASYSQHFDEQEVLDANVDTMVSMSSGYDVTIVCCGTDEHAAYWQARLEDGKGVICSASSLPLAVSEYAWDGGSGSGAGNGLGTLYAMQCAIAKAAEKGMPDMMEKLAAGEISIGLFHTAGKGTRFAPLPGAENNNKPGVRLPSIIDLKSGAKPLTILEAVIKQTGAYAQSRKGRVSVYWGDQLFVPTVPIKYTPAFHVDILAKLGPMPSAEDWKAKGLEKYGLIAASASGEAAQVEKVTYEMATELLATLPDVTSVGTSLGSFSVSAVFMDALLSEYAAELTAKKGKKDTDPHWWMPLTLSFDGYMLMMKKKGEPEDEARKDYARIERVQAAVQAASPGSKLGMFGGCTVGAKCCWWDYGQLPLFTNSMALLRSDSDEAGLYRRFLGIGGRTHRSEVGECTVAADSVVQGCKFAGGSVSDSVACNVQAGTIEAAGAVLINVTAKKIVAPPGAVIYNVCDDSDDGIVVGEGVACVGVWDEAGACFLMKTMAAEDQKKHWSTKIEKFGNAKSYEEVYLSNMDTNVVEVEAKRDAKHAALRAALFSQAS